MRSRTGFSISRCEVHQWALCWLLEANLFQRVGRKCTPLVVLNILIRAATRCISVTAACCDLANGPSDQAVRNYLAASLPEPSEWEMRLNNALLSQLPSWMLKRKWEIAIDLHLSPYYGQPMHDKSELYTNKRRQGTSRFHAYATACIVVRGFRYTLALTSVLRNEPMADVTRRLVAKIRNIGLKIRCFLLDRAFFNIKVIALLQAEKIPFLMPVMIRGPRPKPGRAATGLYRIKRQKASWYSHTMKNTTTQVKLKISVGYRRHKNRKDGKQKNQKLLFGAWRINGDSRTIRERYRKRFGIETSYRQMRQARIHTCTRCPHLRLLFVAIALMLRNLWVWVHQTKLAKGSRTKPDLQLERLRFKRLLDWLATTITSLFNRNETAADPIQI